MAPLRGEETFASRAAKAAAASSRRCCARIRASVAAREALLLPEERGAAAIGGGDGGLGAGAGHHRLRGPASPAPRRWRRVEGEAFASAVSVAARTDA